MTMRARVLSVAAAAVGIVVLMGCLLVVSLQGRRSRDRTVAAEEQVMLLGDLRLASSLYVHALLDAIKTHGDVEDVREEALLRADSVFQRLRALAEQEEAAGGEPSSTRFVPVERLGEAQRRWLMGMATLAREAAREAEVRFLNESRHAFSRDVEPLLLLALQREEAEKQALLRERNQAFEVAEALGVGVPLVSLLLVGSLALTLRAPLRSSLRDFQAGAERMGQGDFGQLLPEHRHDEYGPLAQAFNRMARQLQALIAEKQRQAREDAEACERETRRQYTVLEERVRERTLELEQANTLLTESRWQLHDMQAQLLFSDRLALVGQLAAGIGHEINNPLAFIISNLEFIQAELARRQASAELAVALAETQEGVERVRLIVRELGSLTRPDTIESGPVDLGAVVRSAEKMALHLIRTRARLVREVDETLAVYGNGPRLCQVLLNLLLNAAHAIEPGQARDHLIRVSVRALGVEKVLVEVEHSGCGLAPSDEGRVFDPFFITQAVGMGTGLKLSVCHGIIASHGGELSVESELGKGTTFRVVLPMFARGARDGSQFAPEREASASPVHDEQDAVMADLESSLRRQAS